MKRALFPDPAAREALRRKCEQDLREQKTKHAAPDERLEEFMLWAQADDNAPSGFSVVFVLASAAVVCIVAAVAIAGWL